MIALFDSDMRDFVKIIESHDMASTTARDATMNAIDGWFSDHGIVATDKLASPIEILALPHTQDIRVRLRDWPEGKIRAWTQFEEHRGNFEALLSSLGWHVTMANAVSRNHDLGLVVEVKIAPNFPAQTVEVPRFLYHYTPKKNLENILRNGIEPRSGRKNDKYPPRVYLMLPNTEDGWAAAQAIAGENAVKLEIDTHALTNTSFYQDPELMKSGVWTYEAIPPTAIKVV